jgi:hypothetical protein
VNSRWFSGRALRLHATAFFVVALCLALGWWQLLRALSGNTLSWAYTFEWPAFAAYAVFMWWRLLHEEPGSRSRKSPRVSAARHERDAEEAEKLAAYNRYLSDLHASDRSRPN